MSVQENKLVPRKTLCLTQATGLPGRALNFYSPELLHPPTTQKLSEVHGETVLASHLSSNAIGFAFLRPGQENERTQRVSVRKLRSTTHNTHKQWDTHNQVKHRGQLGGTSDKRHLRSLKSEENVGKRQKQKAAKTEHASRACS